MYSFLYINFFISDALIINIKGNLYGSFFFPNKSKNTTFAQKISIVVDFAYNCVFIGYSCVFQTWL